MANSILTARAPLWPHRAKNLPTSPQRIASAAAVAADRVFRDAVKAHRKTVGAMLNALYLAEQAPDDEAAQKAAEYAREREDSAATAADEAAEKSRAADAARDAAWVTARVNRGAAS